MGSIRDVAIHPRLMEFKDSKFYSRDFQNKKFRFVTLYSPEGEVLSEYGAYNHNGNIVWITPDEYVLKAGDMISEIVEACFIFGEVFLDLYVEDYYKPNPRALSAKRVFRYRVSKSDKTKKTWGGESRVSKIERLYNLEAVDDVSPFYNLSQVIPAI